MNVVPTIVHMSQVITNYTPSAELPPLPTSRKARATYDSLLDAAHRTIRATGKVSPEAITEEAIVSVATFYTYFHSKEHAVAAVFDYRLGTMLSELGKQMTMEALLDEDLGFVMQAATNTVFTSFRSDARIYRLAISLLADSELMRRVYAARERQILEFVEAFIRRGATAGRIRRDDPERLAEVTLVFFQGLQNPTLIRTKDPKILDELTSMLVWVLSP